MDTAEVQSKKKLSILLFIGAGIVIIVASVGIWKMLRKNSTGIFSTNPAGVSDTTVTAPAEAPLTEEELAARYSSSLRTVASEIGALNTTNQSEIISTAEDKLLTVRVPGQKKEVFIQTFLAIGKLKQNQPGTPEATKARILELINLLVSST